MATSASQLVGVGMPPNQAQLVGNTVYAVTGVGTAQATATPLVGNLNVLTTSSGQTAFVPSSIWPIGGSLGISNPAATTALIFPPVGGNFNGGSTDANITVAQNANIVITRLSSVNWISK